MAEQPAAGRRSVFWKVAAILVGVQLATVLLAVLLSARFAYERSLELVENSLRLRLDALAEEVELRTEGLEALSMPLEVDLAARFPDPVTLLDVSGRPIRVIHPNPEVFDEAGRSAAEALPPDLSAALQDGNIEVRMPADAAGGGWALAPIYDADGLLAGGLLVQPLTASIARELAPTRGAYFRATVVVGAFAGIIAVLLGAFFTGRLVRPLRAVIRQVERIGSGDYRARVEAEGDDEFGRLAAAVNSMAAEVELSVETLRATDSLRRELIANVGHDLRTPLAGLIGHVEEAARYLAEGRPEASEEALRSAERQGRYLTQLVDDLFELSLLDRSEPPLRREPVPVAELLSDAARAHRDAFVRDGILFESHIPPGLPTISADGVRLLRVLDNLLSNARRHTRTDGSVRLEALQAGNMVEIRVADSGSGMSEAELELVFDRYYRGLEARTRRDEGTGLGLSISRAIARAHGGELTAESTLGAGSTFTLRLPEGGLNDRDAAAPQSRALS